MTMDIKKELVNRIKENAYLSGEAKLVELAYTLEIPFCERPSIIGLIVESIAEVLEKMQEKNPHD